MRWSIRASVTSKGTAFVAKKDKKAGEEQEGYEPAAPVGGGRSYWELTREDFMKNKLAMVSVFIVFFVATVAVFCPLIANSRPYMITAVFEDRYDEAYFVTLDLAERSIGYEESSALSLGEIRSQLGNSLAEVAAMAPADLQDRLDELRGTLADIDNASAPAYREALDSFEAEFDLFEITLEPTTLFPVFPTLSPIELWFMFWYLLLIPGLVIRRVFKFKFWRTVFGAAGVAVVVTIFTVQIFPRVEDNFPYRSFIDSPEFVENGWSAIRAIVPYGENENITAESRQPPTWLMSDEDKVEGQNFHLLGTDTNGRDVLCRMTYGARISMLVGIVAVSIYVTIGVLLGAMAGYFGGWTDLTLSRIIEIVICFPVLFLILSVQAFLNPSIINIMVALGLVSWTGVARLQRGEFIRLVNLDFVQGVRALGGGHTRIIFMHILPNAIAPILVLASFGIAGSILVESTLGFGVPQPTASWGDLLNNGRNDIQGTWWLTVFPGIAIFLTVTCFNLVGEGVRDALDPRRRQ